MKICAVIALVLFGLPSPRGLKITAFVGFAAATLYELIKCVVNVYEGCFPPPTTRSYFDPLRGELVNYIGCLVESKTMSAWKRDNFHEDQWIKWLKGEIVSQTISSPYFAHLDLEAKNSLEALGIPHDSMGEKRTSIERLSRYFALCTALEKSKGREFNLRWPQKNYTISESAFRVEGSARFSHYALLTLRNLGATTELFVYDLEKNTKAWGQNNFRMSQLDFNQFCTPFISCGNTLKEVATGKNVVPEIKEIDWIKAKNPNTNQIFNSDYACTHNLDDRTETVYSLKTQEVLLVRAADQLDCILGWVYKNYYIRIGLNLDGYGLNLDGYTVEAYDLKQGKLHQRFAFKAGGSFRVQGQLLVYQIPGRDCILKLVDVLNPEHSIILKRDPFWGVRDTLNSMDVDQLYIMSTSGSLDIFDLNEVLT